MSTTFELQADPRGKLGKGASRRLRRAGKVPAILYGGGQDPVPLLLDQLDLMNHFKNDAIYSHVLTLNIGDRTEQAVLRDIQRHPFKPTFLHLDFLRVIADHKLRAHVPIHFANETTARGVKIQGGMISRALIEIEIECLPSDLPEFIEIDMADMELGDSVRLSEIKLPAGVTLTSHIEPGSESDVLLVSIHHAHGGNEEEAAGDEPAAD